MSVWKDIRQKSLGKEKRTEDAERDRLVKNQLENTLDKISKLESERQKKYKLNYVITGFRNAKILNEYFSNDSFSSIEDNYKIL